MSKLYDLARMTTATTGTGTITLGAAVSGYLTFALAGVQNGDVVSYAIQDGANSEVGQGTYTSAGTTLTRTVFKSTNSDALINLSGSAQVFITALKERNFPWESDGTTATLLQKMAVDAGASGGTDILICTMEGDPGSGSFQSLNIEYRNNNSTSNKVQFVLGGGQAGTDYTRSFTFGTDPSALGDQTFFIYDGNSATVRVVVNTDGDLIIGSSAVNGWASSAAATGTVDTALARNAAGVVEVNDGNLGTYRDLKLRSLLMIAGTATAAPMTFTSGTNLTTAAAGSIEFDGTAFYQTAVASARQVSVTEQFSLLTADRTGTNTATAQNIFGSTEDVIALAGATTYAFEAMLNLVRSTGTTAHTLSTLFPISGGSLTSMEYLALAAGGTGSALLTISAIMATGSTGVVVTASNTGATENIMVWMRGHIRVNASGTITPQFQYSATPGQAPQIKRGSFFRCWPLGTNTIAKVGNWS